jgi:hypothetical protein
MLFRSGWTIDASRMDGCRIDVGLSRGPRRGRAAAAGRRRWVDEAAVDAAE